MRYIEVKTKPLNVGGQEFGTRNLLLYLSRGDDRFNSDKEGMKASIKLDLAVEKSVDSHYIELGEDLWQRACAAVEKPSQGYPFRPARLLDPMVEEILGATEEKPELPAEPVAEAAQ
jgi:hypothetical protein